MITRNTFFSHKESCACTVPQLSTTKGLPHPSSYNLFSLNTSTSLLFVPNTISFHPMISESWLTIHERFPVTLFQCDEVIGYNLSSVCQILCVIQRLRSLHHDLTLQSDRSCLPTTSEKEPTPGSAFGLMGPSWPHALGKLLLGRLIPSKVSPGKISSDD